MKCDVTDFLGTVKTSNVIYVSIVGGRATESVANTSLPGMVADNEPRVFSCSQVYPNPFNPTTIIKYSLPVAGEISLVVYDVLGREVAVLANEKHDVGYYSATWNASGAASGLYVARFTVKNDLGSVKYSKVNKLLLVK